MDIIDGNHKAGKLSGPIITLDPSDVDKAIQAYLTAHGYWVTGTYEIRTTGPANSSGMEIELGIDGRCLINGKIYRG